MERVWNREREREGVREQAQCPDPFNRGLSILFASKHPQNTRTLFCLSSSKTASLSRFLSYAAHPPPSFSLISCFSFYSPPLLNSLPSSLSLCSRYGTFYTSPSFFLFRLGFSQRYLQDSKAERWGNGFGARPIRTRVPVSHRLSCVVSDAYLFEQRPSLPSCCCLPPTHPLSRSKLNESHFIIYSSLSQHFLAISPPPCSQNGDLSIPPLLLSFVHSLSSPLPCSETQNWISWQCLYLNLCN